MFYQETHLAKYHRSRRFINYDTYYERIVFDKKGRQVGFDCHYFPQGAVTVDAYFPVARWFDYYTVCNFLY